MSEGNGVNARKSPPSLITGTGGDSGNTSRILAGLDGRKPAPVPRRAARRSVSGWVAGGLALLVAAAAVMAWQWHRPNSVSQSAPVSRVAMRPSAGLEAPPAQPAAIVDVPEEKGPVNAAASAAAPTAAAPASNTPSLAAPAAPAHSNAAPAAGPMRRGAENAPQSARHRASHSPRTADPDADLLAALFRHGTPGPVTNNGRGKKNRAAAAAADSGSAAHAVGATLAQRLKACHEKGFFAGEVCRWQVCDGHWGKDPACPTQAANNDATSR